MENSSEWKNIPEVVAWLNKNTSEHWTWKKVLARFLSQNPETATVFISARTQLERIQEGVVEPVTFGYPVPLEVVQVHQFIEHLLMGFDLESACTQPLALIGFNARFRPLTPVPATALRFSAKDIRGIQLSVSASSLGQLAKEILEKQYPQLGELSGYVSEDKMKFDRKIKIHRKIPTGGSSLTSLLWKLFYDIYEEKVLNGDLELSIALKPSNVMDTLRSMADQVPCIYPLLESVAGGIKYELESGAEKELYTERLRNSIRRWKAANPEILATQSAA